MNTVAYVRRRSITIPFTPAFEALLLGAATTHDSLSSDLEVHARRGLEKLEELEDATELKHINDIQSLIDQTNRYYEAPQRSFNGWHISIAEELLDEIDLLLLTHGDDLKRLGLLEVSQGTVLMLLVVSSLADERLLEATQELARRTGETSVT